MSDLHNQKQRQEPLGLYIHWPFCVSKCPYCDFNSHVNDRVDQKAWERALRQELRYVADQINDDSKWQNMPQNTSPKRVLKSVFFGGGTPSLMPPQTVAALIDDLSLYFDVSEDIEITLEGNPNSIEVNKYQAFKTAGINRVSVGIQSLRADSLQFLGRQHNVTDAKKALEVTKSIFDKSSFDLIYALPGQTLKAWAKELDEALDLAQGHLSLYQLIIEPGTPFYTRYHRGEFALPSEEDSADMFEFTKDRLQTDGFSLYEVSNFAKPGHECIHNRVYWEYDDYICIGPGAHGRYRLKGQRTAVRNHRAPELWLKHVQDQGHGQKVRDALTNRDSIIEHVLMNLRLSEGIHKNRFLQKHNHSVETLFDESLIDDLVREGYLSITKAHFGVTEKGMICLDAITSKLVSHIKDGII